MSGTVPPSLPDSVAALRARVRHDRGRLAELCHGLAAPLPWREAALTLAQIEALAQRLAGIGGAFALPALSAAAAGLESLLERWRLSAPEMISAERLETLTRTAVPLLAELERVESDPDLALSAAATPSSPDPPRRPR